MNTNNIPQTRYDYLQERNKIFARIEGASPEQRPSLSMGVERGIKHTATAGLVIPVALACAASPLVGTGVAVTVLGVALYNCMSGLIEGERKGPVRPISAFQEFVLKVATDGLGKSATASPKENALVAQWAKQYRTVASACQQWTQDREFKVLKSGEFDALRDVVSEAEKLEHSFEKQEADRQAVHFQARLKDQREKPALSSGSSLFDDLVDRASPTPRKRY